MLRHRAASIACQLSLMFPVATLFAQPASAPPATATPAAVGDQIMIKRESLRVIDPQDYRTPLQLSPYQSIAVVSPVDTIVRGLPVKTETAVLPQTELIRLDTTAARLTLTRAQAALKAATLTAAKANGGSEPGDAIEAAKVEIAKADVDLAQFQYDQQSVRSPIAGTLERILVSDGQFVRAGEPLAIVADLTKMKVEIPAERSLLDLSKPVPLQVEGAEVSGRLEAVLPLDDRFSRLRDLFDSIASALVVVDNSSGKYKSGQTVYVPLIPRLPVTELPNSSLLNTPDGARKVQVVRANVVRDIPVALMAGVGADRTFVSGSFQTGDEVVYDRSHALNDGYQLKPANAPAAAGKPGAAGAGPNKSTPGTGGF